MRFLILLGVACLLTVLALLPTIIEILKPKDNKPLFINQNYFADLKYFLYEAAQKNKLLNQDILISEGNNNIATTQNITIPSNISMYGWAHCDHLIMDENSKLDGKASCNKATVNQGSQFRRISALEINMGVSAQNQKYFDWNNKELRNKVVIHKKTDLDGKHLVIDRDLDVNTVAKGDIVVKSGLMIEGSIKANGNITIENGVTILGSIFAEHNIKIGDNCLVYGHIVAENNLEIGDNFQGGFSGEKSKPVTILGNNIQLNRSIVCGTICAKKIAKYI